MEKATQYLKIHPADNVLVALQDLEEGQQVSVDGHVFELPGRVKAKHKFALYNIPPNSEIFMYGVLVGKNKMPLQQGEMLSTLNIEHATGEFTLKERRLGWQLPDVTRFAEKTFKGYLRSDGKAGTANHWLVIPLVFCESKNIEVLKDALKEELGYQDRKNYKLETQQLIQLYQNGEPEEEILKVDLEVAQHDSESKKIFKNIDGIKFLTHSMGCGGTRLDSDALCGLLAGYITHPNVAGATVLSLGCQHAQAAILKKEILARCADFDKPLYILEQQKYGTEERMIQAALKATFVGLIQADRSERQDVPLSKLTIGLECGGSDGFSGISANPAVGYASDLLVALGGSVILSEFPELCGVEQELSDRCFDEATALKFMDLMKNYSIKAEQDGSGFYANPSPGNIRDGLITDAIKSAGAAKKGGTSPIVDVVDYPGVCTKKGLNLLCTPGNDVESTTAEVGAGANIVLFTTGLGTPTGNPIAPVIKISSNTTVFEKMNDIIDVNCGTIIDGKETIEEAGERILDYVISVASGEVEPKAVQLGQDDFIPWRRGISL